MIIDFHTHVLSAKIRDNRSHYVASDPGFALIYSNPKAKIATAEDLIDSMDREGVDISVIVNYGWNTRELCVLTNDYILESIAHYPGRLIGFCGLPSSIGDAIVEIERCVSGGIKGVGELRPDVQFPDFTQREAMQPLIDVLIKHKLILMTHASEPVGHIYPGKGHATPDILYTFITKFPDLPVVCAHWGGGLPFYAMMPEVKEALKNVYFDSAASSFLYRPEIYNQVSQLVGADKILFGTDYPLLTPGRLLREINSIELPQDAKDKMLSNNACRLLGIKA